VVVSVGLTPDRALALAALLSVHADPAEALAQCPPGLRVAGAGAGAGRDRRCGPLADVPGQSLAPEFSVQGGEPSNGE
jgi:hypothetical protein